jgi:hypothetical protein
MKYVIFVFTLLAFSPNIVSAHGVLDGHIVDIRVEISGQVILTFDQPAGQTPPECAAANPKHMAFSLTSPSGSGVLSTAIAAQSTGKIVRARGTGACSSFNVFEDIGYLVLRGN